MARYDVSTMTKREIVRSVSEKLGLTQLDTKDIVQNVLDGIAETLVKEGRLELRNFGVFDIKKRKARKARNPKTGEEALVKEKDVVVFKAGKKLDDALVLKHNPPKKKPKTR